jgi:hypothetical protein
VKEDIAPTTTFILSTLTHVLQRCGIEPTASIPTDAQLLPDRGRSDLPLLPVSPRSALASRDRHVVLDFCLLAESYFRQTSQFLEAHKFCVFLMSCYESLCEEFGNGDSGMCIRIMFLDIQIIASMLRHGLMQTRSMAESGLELCVSLIREATILYGDKVPDMSVVFGLRSWFLHILPMLPPSK